MSDREALTAALTFNRVDDTEWEFVVRDAARERLAQLPEKCGTCEGGRLHYCVTDEVWSHSMVEHMGCRFAQCPSCHGSGKVYPAERVFTVMNVGALPEHLAVAVLDALNGES